VDVSAVGHDGRIALVGRNVNVAALTSRPASCRYAPQ
jgi:hypothetical protein